MERDGGQGEDEEGCVYVSERNKEASDGGGCRGRTQELNGRMTKGLRERERLWSAETAN